MSHELAHYIFDLTDDEKAMASESRSMAADESGPPRIFCRTSDAMTPIERRADYAAACLLAPASLVKVHSKKWARRQGIATGNTVKRMNWYDWRFLADQLAKQFGTGWNTMKRRIYEVGLYSEYRELWAT